MFCGICGFLDWRLRLDFFLGSNNGTCKFMARSGDLIVTWGVILRDFSIFSAHNGLGLVGLLPVVWFFYSAEIDANVTRVLVMGLSVVVVAVCAGFQCET